MPRLKFVVAGGLILGAITYLMFSGISDSMVYYYTVSEALELAQEDAGKGIRVSGYVSSGTIEREEIIQDLINKELKGDINKNKTELMIKLMIMAAIYEFMFMHKTPIKVVIKEYLKVRPILLAI